MSHSLFSHETSSLSSVLFGAVGQKSCDCEPMGKDKGTIEDCGETKDIRTPRRNANIPVRVIHHVVVHHVHRVHRVHRVHITIHTVSVLCGQSRNLLIAPADTQHLVSHTLPRICVRLRKFYLCGRRMWEWTRDFLHPHLVCWSPRRPHEKD